ncbi:MAG TPA: glycine cleavage T C-terminal barrel domain-containing protein, partial [Steroidobacteraceae bacterium]|nr:glycine cleavage T C-terminal barrel domain-containing protein [Steroidobacteraceae bacterium]
IGDFTMCRVGTERVFLICTWAAEVYYRRWFERHPPPAGVTVRPCAMEYVGLSVAGPRSRTLLQSLTRTDLSTAAFPFLTFRVIDIGMVPALVGRAAALEEKESGGALRLVTFSVDAQDADASGDEPIWHEGRVVGWVTSGAYGHRVQRSLALGYIPAALASPIEGFEIEIIGERRRARRESAAPLDPSGSRMRG